MYASIKNSNWSAAVYRHVQHTLHDRMDSFSIITINSEKKQISKIYKTANSNDNARQKIEIEIFVQNVDRLTVRSIQIIIIK